MFVSLLPATCSSKNINMAAATGGPFPYTNVPLTIPGLTVRPTIRLAMTWDEAVGALDWLLEDAVIVGSASSLSATPLPPANGAADGAADGATDGAADGEVDVTYLLGFDTESDASRRIGTSDTLPAEVRRCPSTLQLGSRSRVLVVPSYHLLHVLGLPVPQAFRDLFSRADVWWAGVALAGDVEPLKETLGIEIPPNRVLDVSRVVKKWNIGEGLEELAYQFTAMIERPTPTHAPAHPASVHEPSPAKLATARAALRRSCEACDPCAARFLHPSAPPPVPAYIHDSTALSGIAVPVPDATTADGNDAPLIYPNLAVGWKTTPLTMSAWDTPPPLWTSEMLLYAAIDALASRAISEMLMPPRSTLPPPGQYPAPPVPNPAYEMLHARMAAEFNSEAVGGVLENVRRTMAHVFLTRENPDEPVPLSDLVRVLGAGRLVRGIKDRRAVLDEIVAHLVRSGVVQVDVREILVYPTLAPLPPSRPASVMSAMSGVSDVNGVSSSSSSERSTPVPYGSLLTPTALPPTAASVAEILLRQQHHSSHTHHDFSPTADAAGAHTPALLMPTATLAIPETATTPSRSRSRSPSAASSRGGSPMLRPADPATPPPAAEPVLMPVTVVEHVCLTRAIPPIPSWPTPTTHAPGEFQAWLDESMPRIPFTHATADRMAAYAASAHPALLAMPRARATAVADAWVAGLRDVYALGRLIDTYTSNMEERWTDMIGGGTGANGGRKGVRRGKKRVRNPRGNKPTGEKVADGDAIEDSALLDIAFGEDALGGDFFFDG
ncbi:hypothetical protein BC828DRAFT_191559 [Blastocladiella britannica]|nr:hypothetical protein BC828DRAFT_191559 [Blastocladiella britannica]